ncbi:bifunctional metallophosphatase/5'-nucleotidase [Sediminibacillus massiliensis]|uniref:bifunctional metallophosphatase/5'-nucleotidase n=1 Tax=Sediminibacillus massiliensis TaxID=1926277 RepID=UPI0009882F27|nr:bifunctional UDP-sugar hydrolase/5'-nucleotidase [Sediminibacillus massiliensis]
MEEKLFFYYTNDLHSHFENWPAIIGHFEAEKAIRKKNGQSYWLVDIGDHVDLSHPISEALKGKANVELLNRSGFNVATIGNNEGITLDYDQLYHLYDHAEFQLLCANLESMKEPDPLWLQHTTQLISDKGTKIGVIGLTAPFNAIYNLVGWNISPPLEVLDRYIPKLAAENDIVVLLSHLGIHDDEEIAKRYNDIDVIIGGHTHHLFRDGEEVSGTLLTAAGKHGKYIGEVILTWDQNRKELTKKEAYATSVENFPSHPGTEELLANFNQQANEVLDKPVTHLNTNLEFGWFKETPIMTKFVDTLREWTDADCAMLNAGVLLDRFDKGNVTYGDIHRICPHPMNPCVVKLTGSELIEVVRVALSKQFMELKLKGFGFRGEVIGRMVFSGMEVKTTKGPDGHERVSEVTMDGKQIEPDKEYYVATVDTFTLGRLLPEVARSEYKKFYMPEFIRDLLTHTLKYKF